MITQLKQASIFSIFILLLSCQAQQPLQSEEISSDEPSGICTMGFTWGKNIETGLCYYHNTGCLPKGYEHADVVKDCDCENLDSSNKYPEMAFETCIMSKQNAALN